MLFRYLNKWLGEILDEMAIELLKNMIIFGYILEYTWWDLKSGLGDILFVISFLLMVESLPEVSFEADKLY